MGQLHLPPVDGRQGRILLPKPLFKPNDAQPLAEFPRTGGKHRQLPIAHRQMEGAAVGQVCYVNKTPFAVIRAISDDADGGACEDYPSFAKASAQKSAKTVIELAKRLA